jgi:hypothetical protein
MAKLTHAAMSVWDTLSAEDQAALARVDAIRERLIPLLSVREARHDGSINPREISDEAVTEAREQANAILLCLSGLTQVGLDDEPEVAR